MIAIIYYALELLKWLIIARALLTWFVPPHSRHPVVQGIRRITDPIMRPFENLLPQMGGIDASPLVAFLAIHLLQMLLLRAF